jgi:hypothetical protein
VVEIPSPSHGVFAGEFRIHDVPEQRAELIGGVEQHAMPFSSAAANHKSGRLA